MDRRYNPSCPPPVRPQRKLEGWMVLALVLGLALGSVGLVAKSVAGAFMSSANTIENAGRK